MPQMLGKFGDDFPPNCLRKTGNCLEISELTYAYFVQAVCVPIECLLKHGVSMFEKRVESQKTSLHVDAMFASLIITLSENIKKSNDFPQQNSLDRIIYRHAHSKSDKLHFIIRLK